MGIHEETAKALFNTQEPTDNQIKIAKTINFPRIYGERMTRTEIVARFLLRFAMEGFPPIHNHDSARHKDAVTSQPASALYLDCGSVDLMETVLNLCVHQGWIVAPFGLLLGLGINQETFEATQAGLDAGRRLLDALEEKEQA